jgi:hypothetical protein
MEGLVFRYASSLLATALKLLQYLFLGLALITSATALYTVAYQLIMPTKLHEKELFFDYFPPANPLGERLAARQEPSGGAPGSLWKGGLEDIGEDQGWEGWQDKGEKG